MRHTFEPFHDASFARMFRQRSTGAAKMRGWSQAWFWPHHAGCGPAALGLLGLLLVGIPLAMADNPVDPTARTTVSHPLTSWTFQQTAAPWTATHQCKLSINENRLVVRSTGDDPYMCRPVDLPGGLIAVTLRVRCLNDVGGTGSVFWTTDKSPVWGEDKRADFRLQSDGQWHEAAAHLHADGKMTNMRIDPGTKPGTIKIQSIRFALEELHPLTIHAVQQTDRAVRFQVMNHGKNPVAFSANGKPYDVPGAKTTEAASVWVEQPIQADQTVQPVSVRLDCRGWPALRRTVWVYNLKAKATWLQQPLENCQLQVAANGSVAQIQRSGRLVAMLGPLVTRDGKIPEMTSVETNAGLRFVGKGIELLLGTGGNELRIRIKSDRPCEGPVVRTLGHLEQGLFAGLEYLGRGEQSSSKLDIETEGHIRFAPDPLKVTMPLMAFVTDRASVSMTWTDMTLQPVYATPNVFDGTSDHRMTLQGNNIDATIRIDQQPLEEAILWAVNKQALPPLPSPPRSAAEQRAICLTALNGPLKNEHGWGHCVQEKWQRRPFADMASTIWRLGGEVPALPDLVPGGAHVRNGTIYFVTGRAQKWLDVRRRQVQQHIRRQQPDGSYRYDGKYRRGHFENTASGVCALPAAQMLDFAYVTGDRRAQDAGLHTLEFMKRFRTPRGAQVWECALHTPDQLASAYLVWAYVRGYQLTGDRSYLEQARKWALSGIPFTYMWHCYPVMCYATPPVYGATNWRRPNWMGLPVQWVGSVYAYALTMLAPFDKTLDWKHLARGILISAQQQQYASGPHVGLLPDSFKIRAQRRQPADINPCALVSLQWVLDGKTDFLNVATNDHHRVAAPFPVTLHGSTAQIDARSGITYQVLVDGQQIIDVTSHGKDIVKLKQ